jgi:hypothetical protein
MWPMLLPIRLDAVYFSTTGRGGISSHLLRSDHCIVLFGFTRSGKAVIGNPAALRETRREWSAEELERRWLGEGLRLVKRR